MTFQEDLEDYYQLEEDVEALGLIETEAELIDFASGVDLIDGNTSEQLTGESFEFQALSESCYPVVITNDEDGPALVNVTNRQQSEVDTSLLGIPRSETALSLLENVNIYGVNTKEWTADPGGGFGYTYYQDPSDWTFRDNYGNYCRHLPAESAVQAYCFPPPVSFSFTIDDNSGRFPGGYTNGVMNAYWETKRTFRYQPGRVTAFTFGTRMSTGSSYAGEVVQWGCRNDYGDGYYFQLEKGTDLFIIYRRFNSILNTIEEVKFPRLEWTGDKILINEGLTNWGLDLSRVTMFKIEFSWYGAVGAKFLAYVPVDHDEARWVELHYVVIENQLEFPSLKSAFMKMFIQARNTAGAVNPAFINLYGSSVYIDGGDKGTVTLGSAALGGAKNIDSTSRAILGLQVKGQINNIDNQKAVYPVSLAEFASTEARFDLVLQGNGTGAGESYYYGNGTNLTKSASSGLSVTLVNNNVLQISGGTFADVSAELSGSTNYLTGRRVRVTGTNIFNTHVVAINPGLTQITTDRAIPAGTTSIRLSRMNSYAISSGITPTGASGATGSIFFNSGGGQWRLGAWFQASGAYSTSQDVMWFASKYTGLNFDRNGNIVGEIDLPFEPYRQTEFSITFPSGTSNTLVSFGGAIRTLTGVTNPWPMVLVAELMDSSQLNDVVLALGTPTERITPNSGSTTAITQWANASGLTQDTTAAGGAVTIANKFQGSSSDPLSAVLVDTQGYRTLFAPQRVATYFLGANEMKQFDLSGLFGPDKMFITGKPGTINNSGALFVVATARVGSGVASATLNWEEQ